ncbi:MAG TPA: bifunctional 4-hydroxy-2-oxoglutarate aldolase/2-dehydro-3-deoxy-phosphogluconate aldolase [Bryobacteraceae bacterium]|nr:bifunctional 4-hydroxy-2-oxoglutarate aldolase/2-dehydro-3-deoxy-phosphogluconate aldolase [Bryobacteraceae bacterium]
MTKEQVRGCIEAIAIIPAVRVSSQEDALFACEAVAHAGIPIVELTMTVPGAVDLLAAMWKHNPGVIAGAGTVLDLDTAKRCVDAGAQFLTSPGLELDLVEFANRSGVLVLPGALTPTEVLTAWKVGGDMVKVYPCSQVGGAKYIRSLKGPFPKIPLIASGGVNHHTAPEFILAGAAALGIGGNLIPKEAIQKRQPERIAELARRFRETVAEARALMAPR